MAKKRDQNAGNRIGNALAQYGAQYGMGGAAGASGTVGINGKVVTPQQWQQGALLRPPEPFAGIPGPTGGITGQPSIIGPGASAQPVDPYLESQRLTANRNVAITKGNAAYDTGNLGFDLGYNPDGTINTANPYSRAAILQLSHEHEQARTTNSMAARGQLYSGAYGRARASNDFNYGRAENANRLAYQRGTHGIQRGLLGAYANAGAGVSDADFQALLRATYPGG